MALKRRRGTRGNNGTRGGRQAIRAVKGGTSRLRKEPRSASTPETAKEYRSAGVLRFETQEYRLPEALAEAGETESNGVAPGRVVMVIATLAIVFIAIMAWFVSQMQEK